MVAKSKKKLHGRDVGSEKTWNIVGFQEAEMWVGTFQAGRTAITRQGGGKHRVCLGNTWLNKQNGNFEASWKNDWDSILQRVYTLIGEQ